MKYDEILALVEKSCPEVDWEFMVTPEKKSVHIFKKDISITIEREDHW